MTNSLSAEISPSTAVVIFVVTAINVALVADAVVVQKQLDGSGGELK